MVVFKILFMFVMLGGVVADRNIFQDQYLRNLKDSKDSHKIYAEMRKLFSIMESKLRAISAPQVHLAIGPPGPPGPQGIPGKDGKQGPPGSGSSAGGTSYIRWGKTSCPPDADFVYKGYMGGESHNHKGGGVNYLCLTREPKYLNTKNGFQAGGRVYGTEYQVSDNAGLFKRKLHDHDAPCAACYVKTRSAKMTIPGTYECPEGWTREYYGYLMTEQYGHVHPKDFICVDRDAEAIPGTHENKDGALLYPVQGTCGSLPCKPYVNGYELTCAVCTK